MSVLAPPKPPPHEDPEALIEEARRRARRRRLAFVAAARGRRWRSSGTVLARRPHATQRDGARAVPEGFHLVRARGPVEHTRTAEYLPFRPTVIDLATGREHRVPVRHRGVVGTTARAGLVRAIVSVDGRVALDGVGQACAAERRASAFPPPVPFNLAAKDLKWPVDPKVLPSGWNGDLPRPSRELGREQRRRDRPGFAARPSRVRRGNAPARRQPSLRRSEGTRRLVRECLHRLAGTCLRRASPSSCP